MHSNPYFPDKKQPIILFVYIAGCIPVLNPVIVFYAFQMRKFVSNIIIQNNRFIMGNAYVNA
jgi:hypothetical protein